MTLDLDLQMSQLDVKLLRAQFNSHFLFNNLNAINYCILQNDTQKASTYLTLFSRFLRRTVEHSQRDFVKLTDEIETLNQYVQIEMLRFARTIQLVVSIEPGIAAEEIWVPSLILHSYIESMIWHNLNSPADQGELMLGIKKKSGKYHILLETNGMSPENTHPRTKRHGTDLKLKPTKNNASGYGTGVDLSFTPLLLPNFALITRT